MAAFTPTSIAAKYVYETKLQQRAYWEMSDNVDNDI